MAIIILTIILFRVWRTGAQGNCDARTVRENALNYPFPGSKYPDGTGIQILSQCRSVLRTLYVECRCLCSAARNTCMHYPFFFFFCHFHQVENVKADWYTQKQTHHVGLRYSYTSRQTVFPKGKSCQDRYFWQHRRQAPPGPFFLTRCDRANLDRRQPR